MLLFYIRHGEPIYDPDSLTPLGHRQAEALAKRLAVYGVDKIYSSTSKRACLTAIPTSEVTKIEIEEVDFFNEKYAFEFFTHDKNWMCTDSNFRKLFVSDEIMQLGYKWYEHPTFSNEKVKEGLNFYKQKIDDFLLSLGYSHDRKMHIYRGVRPNDDRIAIFAHEGFGGVFLSEVLDIPYPLWVAHHSMFHSTVTVIQFENQIDSIIPKVLQFGNDSHLYQERLPTVSFNGLKL